MVYDNAHILWFFFFLDRVKIGCVKIGCRPALLLLIVKTYYLSMMLKLYFWNTLRHTLTPSLSTQMVQSDAGVGYSVIFPSFCRGGSPLRVACVFTAGLSPIILALQIFFILPVSSFPIFCDSCSALFALEHFSCFVPPLILSVLE